MKLQNALSIDAQPSPINIQQAISQHENYTNILNDDVGINIFESDAHDEYPDCVFIEDTAVVISNDTVVSRIGAKLRQEEVDAVKDTEN